MMDESNSLVLSNYKEPLKKIPKGKGYGYYGAILVTPDKSQIQCHVCGGLYEALPLHILKSHPSIKGIKKYREIYDLARRTSLVSEKVRFMLKERTLKWMMALTPEQRHAHMRKARKSLAEYRRKHKGQRYKMRLETKNLRGTCPDQIIAKIRKFADSLGRTPTQKEFMQTDGGDRYMYNIRATFGTWRKAIKRAGLKEHSRNFKENGIKNGTRYTDEELLEYLHDFFVQNGKIPTESDARRGLIPNTETYRYRFGSLITARELAGIKA